MGFGQRRKDPQSRREVLDHASLLEATASRFDRRNSFLAEWALRRLVRSDVEGQQRLAPHTYINGAAASIHHRACADDNAIRIDHRLDGLASRASRSDDVLDDEDSLTTTQSEAAAKSHHSRLAFGEKRARANRAGGLMSVKYPADGRSYNRGHPVVAELRGQRPADEHSVLRVLKNERTLQIAWAVQARRQLKVAFQQRAGLLEDCQ
jgi:hypothetical protein